ncbi:MAG: MFS transporter [Kiritimatiellae bacterium]|nr:MFS transporter [Kiritimatiellia bacterium]
MQEKENSFIPLFVTNFFGTLNDNFLKTLASFTVIGWLQDERVKSIAMGFTAGALVLPYILCSPLADRLTAIWPKRRIVQLAKWAELPIMAVAVAGFALKSPWLVIGAVLLMGLQSSLYSPAKYALVRDVGGEGRISTGMGGMEGVSFLGVLMGTVAASVASDRMGPVARYACLVVFAALGLAASYTVRAKEQLNRALHAINPVRYIRRSYRMAARYDGLNAVIFSLSVFWWAAAMLQMGLLVYGKSEAGLNLDATRTGGLLCAAAVGIVLGQVIAGVVDRRRFLLGATLLTGWIAAALLLVLYFAPLSPRAFAVVLGLLAFDLGFFKLPFDAEIQKVVKGPKLNTMLAYFNQVSFLFMLAASGCYALVSWAFGPKAFFLLLAIVFLVAPFAFVFCYRSVLLCTGHWVFSRRYKVEIKGMEDVVGREPRDSSNVSGHESRTTNHEPRTAALLVLPNHPAMVDPMLVSVAFWKTPLKPLSDESFFHTGIVAPRVLKTLGAVPVPDLRKHRTAKGATIARGLGDIVKSTLEDGGNVIFYPSGHIQTEPEHEDIGTRQLAYNICGDLPEGVRVIGVRTRGLWGSIWSRKGRKNSPSFVPTFIKSVLLWFFWSPFVPRRRVTMHIEDLTDRVKEWSHGTRLEFNRKLEEWYNDGDEADAPKTPESMFSAWKERINPGWVKLLSVHSAAIAVVMLTVYGYFAIGLGFADTLRLGVGALFSPVIYPLVSPYLVAFALSVMFGLCERFPIDYSLSWIVVLLAYAAYFTLLSGSVLHRGRIMRIICSMILVAWFALTLFGLLLALLPPTK